MIEWKTGNDRWDDTADEREPSVVELLESRRTEEPPQHPNRRRRIVILLSLLAALVAVTGAVLKWSANRNVAAVRANVQSIVDREMWALETGNWDLYESLLDQHTPARWYREQQSNFVRYSQRGAFSAEITDLALAQPDLALAEVRIDPPGRQAYRETRAYRQVGNTWHRTTTAGHLWLHPVVRETANLRFVYHREDADRLEPLLPALQELYAQLLADFGLSPLPNRRELQIVLSVQPANSAFADASQRYDLSSLATTPDTERIQRELGAQLTGNVMRQFYDNAGDMAFVLNGIREWEAEQWGEVTGYDSGWESNKKEAIQRGLKGGAIPPLSGDSSMIDRDAMEMRYYANITIAEYVVSTYGRHRFADIVKAAIEHEHLQDLIPAALDVDLETFEAGWREYLERTYGQVTVH